MPSLGLGVDQEDVAERPVVDGAVGDPHLAAGQQVAVALAAGRVLRMPSTSVPPSGSVMPMPPIHSPEIDLGQVALALGGAAVAGEVVHEQHACAR